MILNYVMIKSRVVYYTSEAKTRKIQKYVKSINSSEVLNSFSNFGQIPKMLPPMPTFSSIGITQGEFLL